MKKLLLLLIALTLGMGLKAQCPYTTAIDFTATDVHGTEVHLFDILDGGQYVFIDFFFTTCGPCQQACPKIVEAYSALGCNMHDVYFMEIDSGDGEQACINWVNNYGVEYPTISGVGGGTGICGQYGIQYYPTVILIAPDRSIVIQDLYPIPSAQTVINALAPFGIEQHDCTAPVGELTVTPDTLWFSEAGQIEQFIINNGTEDNVTIGEPILDIDPHFGIRLGDNTPEFPYVLEAGQSLPIDVLFRVSSSRDQFLPSEIWVSTSLGIWKVVLMLYDTAIDRGLVMQGGQSVTFDEGTSIDIVFYNGNYGTHTDIQILSITENETDYLEIVPDENLPYTLEEDIYFYLTLNLKDPARTWTNTSITIETSEGPLQFEVLINDNLLNITESTSSITLFPNPANENVTLKGEHLGTVSVYNAFGQKVDEFTAEGSELNINTAQYENGVYVAKTGEKNLRFVINH